MEVIYSCATHFGGSGIGTTSYYAGYGIYCAGNLKKLYCSSYKLRDIPASFLYSTHSSFIEGLPFVPSMYQWLLKDNYHDFLVSFKAQKTDIFHGWNGHSLLSIRQFKKKGATIVIERASTHPLTQIQILNVESLKRGIKATQMLPLNLRKLLREFEETDYITIPSQFAFDSMVEQGIKKEKLVLLPFGVDLDKFKPVRQKHSSQFNALFVGQVGLRKGVLYLLEAWRSLQLKDALLTIVGQLDSQIVPLIAPYQSDPSIRFLGFADALSLYQSSDVFIFPSLEEGSALVTYEALACGLPVITTPNSGSIVEHGKQGYLVPGGESEKLAEKIAFLYKNTETRREMGIAALKLAATYSWEDYGKRLNSFYEKITS